MDPFNVCFFGVGGLGGYLGVLIAGQKKYDIDTSFIARGKHLEEINRNGLILNIGEKRFACRPTLATENIKKIPSPDLVFLGVKSYDLEKACIDLENKVSKRTVIIPLLNGVDIYSGIRNILAEPVIFPTCVYINGYIDRPGVINHQTGDIIIIGKDPENPDYDPGKVLSLLDEANIRCQWHEDPLPAIWRKYMFIATYSLVTAFYRLPIGGINENTGYTNLAVDIMTEIKKISIRQGINLSPEIIEKTLKIASRVPYETRTSYQRDVETEGKKSEDTIYGETIIRLGKKYGIPTPATEMVYNKIMDGKNN